MSRSIFDPTGPDTERSGSRNLGPDASQGSQMPSDVTDGVVSEEEAAEYRAAGLEPPAPPSDIIDMGDAGKPNGPDDSSCSIRRQPVHPGHAVRT